MGWNQSFRGSGLQLAMQSCERRFCPLPEESPRTVPHTGFGTNSAAELGISKHAVCRVCKEAGLKPHHLVRYMTVRVRSCHRRPSRKRPSRKDRNSPHLVGEQYSPGEFWARILQFGCLIHASTSELVPIRVPTGFRSWGFLLFDSPFGRRDASEAATDAVAIIMNRLILSMS